MSGIRPTGQPSSGLDLITLVQRQSDCPIRADLGVAISRGPSQKAHVRSPRWLLAIVCVAAWLFPSFAFSEVTGSIAGTVRDSSGGILQGAVVTISGPALQREQMSVTTGSDGTYRMQVVPPGAYDVSVRLPGFAEQVRHGVDVTINHQTTLDFLMPVAGLAEQVEVSAAAPQIEVTRSDVTSTVSQQTIDSLPLNGRNFTDLIALVPGAKPDPTLSAGGNVEIFGERPGAVSYLVDGAENNDPVNGGALLRFTQDSIKEFEVITTGYQAEFGRAQGGVANIVTRSGTDSFDGRAFWFGRNNHLDSSNIPAPSPLPAGYRAPEPPKLRRYQWGGTLGGPIVRERAFFFGSFEKLDETRGLNFDLSRIPAFVRAGGATPNHVEDFGITPDQTGFSGLVKADVNVGRANHFTASLNRSTRQEGGLVSSPVGGTLALPSAAATLTQPATSVVVRDTAVLGQALFVETTADYVRGESGNNLNQARRSEPLLLLLNSGNGGFLQTGAPFGGQTDQRTRRIQATQSVNYVLARAGMTHQFKFGWDYNRVSLAGRQQVTNDVEYSADFLNPDQALVMARDFGLYGFQQSAARFFTLPASPDGSLNVDMKSDDAALFAQDTWDVHPSVTLNAGVRYDYSSLSGGYKRAIAPRVGVAWDIGGRHQTIVKVDYGLFFDRNLLGAAATVPEKGGAFTKSVFDVALPRLGVDYANSLIDYVITSGFPTDSGAFGPPENPAYQQFATDLRRDPLALYRLLGIAVSDPASAPIVTADNIRQLSGRTADQVLALLTATYPGTDWRFFDVPGGSIVGNRVLSFFPRGTLDATRQVSRYTDDMVPFTNAFNAGIERQLFANLSVSANYVRRRSRDLLTRRIINLYDAPPGNPAFGRTTDGGPQINAATYDGLVDYDGLVVSARRRFTGRYELGVSYTASRARDNLLTPLIPTTGTSFSNNNHPEYDYGPSNQSAPHVFVASGLVIVPFEIRLSSIASWRTGAAFNPRGIIDSDGDGLVDQRDLSIPRNSFRVKPYADVDLRIEKRFVVGCHAVSLLGEVFNVFNRDNVATVNAVSGAGFGTPVTYLPGREVQLGIRLFLGEGGR
jgi:outer membrane receptor protein involved in Fe transport